MKESTKELLEHQLFRIISDIESYENRIDSHNQEIVDMENKITRLQEVAEDLEKILKQ